MGFWFTPRFCDCRRFLPQAFFIRHFDFFEVASSIAGANISPRPPALQGTASPVFPEGKKVQEFRVVDDVPEKKEMDLWKQMSSKWSFTCIWVLFCPLTLPRLQFMLGVHLTPSMQSSFFILHPAYYSQSAVFILHSVCILPLIRSVRFTMTVFPIIAIA